MLSTTPSSAAAARAADDTDATLLARYARGRDQAAFAAIVARHVHMVHAAALRQTRGNRHLADDVTQAVFIVLARRAGTLALDRLPAWLLVTARLCAKDAVRREARRTQYEQRAAAMKPTAYQPAPAPAPALAPHWTLEQISPHLDRALCQLRPRERTAVALRFLEDRSFEEIGRALGLSQNAAQKVVARALEKLRRMLAGRRVMFGSAATLSAALLESAAHAAPGNMLGQIITISLGQPGVVSAGTSAGASASAGTATSHAIAEGAMRAAVMAARLRWIVGGAAVAVVAGGMIAGAAAMTQARRPAPAAAVAPANATPFANADRADPSLAALHEYARPYPSLDPIVPKLIEQGRTADLAALLDEMPWQIDARTPDNGGFTPLLLAARHGNIEIVKLLIRRGAYLEAENLRIGYTAINEAAYRGDAAVVKALLDAGADVNHRARRGLTALGLHYYALDRNLITTTPQEAARTEQMLIAAGSIPPQMRLKDQLLKRQPARATTARSATQPAGGDGSGAGTTVPFRGPVRRGQRPPEPSPRANASDGVLPGAGELVVTFQVGNARLAVTPPNSAAPELRLFYIDRGFLSAADEELLLSARFRIAHEPETAAELNITPEQIRRLRSLAPPPPGMLASPADLAELQRLWGAYRAAAKEQKARAAGQVVAALSRVSVAARQATREAYVRRAREVEAILSPEQLAEYRDMVAPPSSISIGP